MKYFRARFLVSCFLIATLLTNCVKDNEGFQITENFGDSTVFGIVLNSENEPISSAQVSYDGIIEYTDRDGIYRFTDVSVSPQHNGLRIEKDGYFESSRTFRTATPGILYQSTILQEKSFDYSFQSSSSAELENGPARIKFPANAIVYEDTGLPYDGQVQVAIYPIDPTVDQLSQRMPGDLSAIEEDDTITTLESFGMVYVEMESTSGEKLQIAENTEVELSYRIDISLRGSAPATIDMWTYNFDLGAWIKEGQAIKSGDGVRYVGMVKHFSCWNYDVSAPSVVVSGQVVSDIGDLTNFQISLLNSMNKGGRGSTDDQGKFSGRVEAGVPLTLTVSDYNAECSISDLKMDVGPFDTDTDLGIINFVVSGPQNFAINGLALDCDMIPVVSGKVFVSNRVFPIEDGVFNIVFSICDIDDFTDAIRIVDTNNSKQVLLLDVLEPGVIELGDVIVCDEAYNLTVSNLNEEPDVFTDPIAEIRYNQFNNLSRVNILKGVDTTPFADISFFIGEGQLESIEVGEYAITEATFSTEFEDFTAAEVPVGSASVLSSTQTPLGLIIVGIYSIETKSSVTGELKVITGSFNTLVP